MITIQYEPIKNLFRIEADGSFFARRSLDWLKSIFAYRMIPYNWQIVMDNPQQKFLI